MHSKMDFFCFIRLGNFHKDGIGGKRGEKRDFDSFDCLEYKANITALELIATYSTKLI